MSHILYTKNNCTHCDIVKRLITPAVARRVVIKNIDDSKEIMAEWKATGARGAPALKMENGDLKVGSVEIPQAFTRIV